MDDAQGSRFDAEGHGQLAPEFAVELYGHLGTGGPGADLLGGERPHRAVQGPTCHDPGEDVGPEEGAHALDEDGLERTTRQEAGARHLVVPAVEVPVSYYGEPRDVRVVAMDYLQLRELVPEKHPE